MSLSAGQHARPAGPMRAAYTPQHRCFRCRPAVSDCRLPGQGRDVRVQAGRNLGTQIIGGGLGGGNEVFVAGADGELGVRVVQKLLQAGFKVAAGVANGEQAQGVVEFATSVELLNKQEAQKLRIAELNVADLESISGAIPRRSRVVVISNSSAKVGSKLDGKAVSRILEAAQENDVQQFVLVTPAGGGGAGGFFGNLFGSASVGGSGRKPSKVEQDVASSELDFAVIRTGKTEVSGTEFESSNNIALGPQGSLPPSSSITKAQVAAVVAQILRQADADVLIEAWAGPQEPKLDIEELVAKALPGAKIEEEEEEEKKEENASPVQAVQEAVEEADVPEEVEKPARSFFGGFGTRKVQAKPSTDEAEDTSAPGPKKQPTPPPAKRGPAKSDAGDSIAETGTQRVGLFGFGRKKAEQEEEEEPAKPQRGFLGMGSGKKPQAEEQEAESPSSSPLKNLFGSKKKDPADVSAESARTSAVRGAKAVSKTAKRATPPARPAPSAAARKRGGREEGKPEKKGFLASIGFDTEKYSYEDD